MAFSNLMYDPKSYAEQVRMSTGTLQYLLDPMKYDNCNKCRVEDGIVGGNDVSLNKTNLVDVESDLMGRTRQYTKYGCSDYAPTCPHGKCKNSKTGIPYDCQQCQPPKHNLKPCTMFDRIPKPTGPGYTIVPPMCPPAYAARVPTFTPYQTVQQSYKPSMWQGNTGT